MLILAIFDEYLRIILTSWPAVILILSVVILLRYGETINEVIKRIKSVSPRNIDIYPPDYKNVRIPTPEREFPESQKSTYIKDKVALVSCKIASSLPGTVVYDFLEDWKVWFWIANPEAKRYRSYVKIKFITEGYEKEINEGYYGGTQAWNLNAFTGIRAPGLGIPNEIKEAAKQKKQIKIKINCIVKNERDEMVEEKLPYVYAYEYERKDWYLEPSQGS